IQMTHYEKMLRGLLRSTLPNEPDIEILPFYWDKLMPDLHRLSIVAKQQIENDIAALVAESDKLQNQIDEVGAQINECNSRLKRSADLFKFDDSAVRETDTMAQRQKEFDRYHESSHLRCYLGGVLYQDCDYVKARQENLRVAQLKDIELKKQAEARRDETQRGILIERNELNREIARLNQEREILRAKRKEISANADNKRDKLRALRNAGSELEVWSARHTKPGEVKEIDDCQLEIEETAKRIDAAKSKLNLLLRQHADARSKLSRIFSRSVKEVLKEDEYDGSVSLNNRGLTFSIVHGPLMSGEAVDTLSILLADISCLVYNSFSKSSHLPGFLLHDSHREADLGLSCYNSFIRFVASLAEHFGTGDNCPFQYIVTTTTPPPKELHTLKYLKLRLNALKPEGLLLGRRIGLTVEKTPEFFAE